MVNDFQNREISVHATVAAINKAEVWLLQLPILPTPVTAYTNFPCVQTLISYMETERKNLN